MTTQFPSIRYTETGRGADDKIAVVSGAVRVPGGGYVATLEIPPGPYRETLGPEIARRWNVHDDLVAALRGLLSSILGSWPLEPKHVTVIGVARALLARLDAEGGAR